MPRLISGVLILTAYFTSTTPAQAQSERKEIRQGVREYARQNYSDSELSFRKALSIDSTSVPALYNLAASLYRQQRFEEARQLLDPLSGNTSDPSLVADVFHNLGNAFLSEKDYQKSIEAYKNSLRIRPSDQDTKYNLAYAQEMLKQQQQQGGDDQEKQEDNKQNEQDQQSPENQDQPQEQKEDQNGNNQSMRKEDMERLLQAIQQNEKKVKEKADKEKAKAATVKTEKDW
jgi:tetratricopeptide (TPR) repeat protein